MVLCAFGLPQLPSGAFYRVRVLVSGGWVEDGTVFRPRPTGEIVLPLRTHGAIDALRGMEIVSEPDGTPVLSARIGGRAE